MADETKTAGSLVDSLGIEYEPEEGSLIVGGALLLKVIDAEGRVTLSCRWSDGIGWIEKVGMLRYAEKFEAKWLDEEDDDDD